MIYKEIDYGSYESPNSIILGMVNEAVICGSGDGNTSDNGYDDENDMGEI